MQIFDYHLNPKLKKETFFQSFYFKPEIKEEEKLGSLCIIGESTNFLSKNKKLLNQIAEKIKQEFYSDTTMEPKKALNRALNSANQLLNNIENKQGNLHFSVINVQEQTINFSKSGSIKLLLLRNGQYFDMAENLEFQGQNAKSYFSNIAVGQITTGDKIILFTHDLNHFFETHISNYLLGLENFNHKNLNKLIKEKKQELKQYSGLLFIILINNQRKRIFRKLPRIRKEILLIILFILILLFSYLIFK